MQRSKGFTLLEMLVVMVITSLMATILFSGLHWVLQLRQRFTETASTAPNQAMYQAWFRQIIEGLQPDYREGKGYFRGSEREIAGMTTAPFTTEYGAPEQISLSLAYQAADNRTELRVMLRGQSYLLDSWPGRAGRFEYEDNAGQRTSVWEIKEASREQIPAAILLYRESNGPLVVAATPLGPHLTPMNVQNAISGGKP
ncbi:prepilin-type N-terminal cleavage/methylation domain-containing protein [Chitinimonas naiadis]